MRVRLTCAVALLSTGFLTGAFGYGAVNLAPTFRRVPLQMRLEFHTELMKNNSVSMQIAMAVAASSCLALALFTTGRSRVFAGAAAGLVIASFLITRLGNVPINHQINRWAVDGAPADHAEILTRWDCFHDLRTATALIAFALVITLVLRSPRTPEAVEPATAAQGVPPAGLGRYVSGDLAPVGGHGEEIGEDEDAGAPAERDPDAGADRLLGEQIADGVDNGGHRLVLGEGA